jgi:hypothetical protein
MEWAHGGHYHSDKIVKIWACLNVVGFCYHWCVYPFILLNLVFLTQAATEIEYPGSGEAG